MGLLELAGLRRAERSLHPPGSVRTFVILTPILAAILCASVAQLVVTRLR